MFQGYSNETFEFFMAIRFNNNRSFFQENRDWYLRGVRNPSIALAEALGPMAEELDPELERRPHRVVSRINRDIRFSHDKSPYRDCVWLAFRRPKEERCMSLGAYFDLSDAGASYGIGFYRENRMLMNALRHLMETDPQPLLEAYLAVRDEFALFMQPNRRMKVPECVPAELREWYTAKAFYLEKDILDFDLIRSAELADEIRSGWTRLKPLFHIIRDLAPIEDASTTALPCKAQST